MKKAIGILRNPDNGAKPMKIYFNGSGEPMTAENNDIVESLEYCPVNEADAKDAALAMYSAWPWDYEELF